MKGPTRSVRSDAGSSAEERNFRLPPVRSRERVSAFATMHIHAELGAHEDSRESSALVGG
jgi:hypothetical protein